MDKPFPPTRERIRRALAEGGVPVSPAVPRAAAFVAALFAAQSAAPALSAAFRTRLTAALATPDSAHASSAAADVVLLVTPLAALAAAVALVATLAQTRGAISLRSPRLPRESRPFAARLREAALSAVVAVLLVGAAVSALSRSGVDAARALSSAVTATDLAASVALRAGTLLALVLAAGAAASFASRYFEWRARLHMSKRELMDEIRRSEGDPEMRRRRKRSRAELLDS